MVGCAFMYNARRVLLENDSVSPPMTQRITNPHQYQVVKRHLMNLISTGARLALTSGRREMAKSRSDAVRYGARVVVGVSGKRSRP